MNTEDDSADEDEPILAGQASQEGIAETASPFINLAVHLDCQYAISIGTAIPVCLGRHGKT